MARHWNADMSWRNWRIWMNTFSYLGLYLLGFFVHLLLQFFFYSGFFQAINPPFNTLSSMIRMCRVGRKKQNKVMLMFPYKNKLLSREKTKKKKKREGWIFFILGMRQTSPTRLCGLFLPWLHDQHKPLSPQHSAQLEMVYRMILLSSSSAAEWHCQDSAFPFLTSLSSRAPSCHITSVTTTSK